MEKEVKEVEVKDDVGKEEQEVNIPALDENLEKCFTACDVRAKYDVISFEFYLYTDSFVFRSYGFDGYRLNFHYEKASTVKYLPSWSIDRFQNIETENLVYYKISSRFYDGNGKPMYMVKIDFHGESSPLTITEINQFFNLVKINYGTFLKGIGRGLPDARILNMPEPYCSKVEISLDFHGENVELLHENIFDNLYKVRHRIRELHIDDEQEKPFHTFDGRVLYGHQATHYISQCYRDYLYDDSEGNAVYRLEIVLTKSYLMRKGIKTAGDIENFNRTLYWTENYFFFRFDEDRIKAYIDRTFPEEAERMNKFISIAIHSTDVIAPIKVYEALKSYTVGDRRLFTYPSRQLLATKWKNFDIMIQAALSRLTLAQKPFIKIFYPIERKRDKAPKKRGRRSMEQDIITAIESLRARGLEVRFTTVKKEAGISDKTMAKYSYLLKS